MENLPKKSLGQHWLRDMATLSQIADHADLNPGDAVLEIGPGPGDLTAEILSRGAKVFAVEFDRELSQKLAWSVARRLREMARETAERAKQGGVTMLIREPEAPAFSNLEVFNEDFLQFDLAKVPKNYKVVANIPYYITNKIIMKLLIAENKPSVAVLLVQKEVAERLAAGPGKMSVLAIATQLYADVELGQIVKSQLFTPPPKVDSQIVILRIRESMTFHGPSEQKFFRVVKAGFSARRKKLRTALAGGLGISKIDAEQLLRSSHIDPNKRAQDLSIDDWARLAMK